MNFLKGAWNAVSTWFGGLNITAIEIGLGAVAIAGYSAFLIHIGLHWHDADIAKNNAKMALEYQANVTAANESRDRESQRAQALLTENIELKQQVQNAAQGNASPGVSAAINGLRPHTATRPAKVPRT